MNVFIVAVCVNLLILVNAGQNTYFETLAKIMKSKPRRSGHSNNVGISDPEEVIPILPGFYLEKPKDLPKSLFKNPKAWPDDIYAILKKEEADRSKTKVNVDNEIKTSKDEYLQAIIQKAVEDHKIFRASQKQKSDKKLKALHINSESAQKVPVKKLLGQVFQGMNRGMDYKRNQQKPKKNTGSKNNKIFDELLRNILSGNLNNHPYQKSAQHAYAKPEEKSQSKEELLGNILNAIQNNDPGRESETDLRPSMVIISPTSLEDDDYVAENNAKEEISDEDYGSSDLRNLNTRRKSNDHDIGGRKDSLSSFSSSSSDSSSDYEKNPGNPYTVHKNKYKQNWPYNHFMDGDHMNINPFGPQFGSLGPSGPDLFFGRKWWYFNQDDYKPMG